MDWDDGLLWLTLAGTGALVVRLWPHRQRLPGWFRVAAGTGALTLALLLLAPSLAGYLGGSLYLGLILLPGLLGAGMRRLVLQQRFGAARTLARAVRLLHPWDGAEWTPRLMHALDLHAQGRSQEARDAMAALQEAPPAVSQVARLHRFRMDLDWEGARSWLEHGHAGAWDVTHLAVHLRALGETGRRDAMLALWMRHAASLQGAMLADIRQQCRLPVLAFSGRREGLERLLEGPLRHHPPSVKDGWRATALQAAGQTDLSVQVLQRARAGADAATLQVLRSREQCPVAPAVLSPEQQACLDALEQELAQEVRFGVTASAQPLRVVPAVVVLCTLTWLAGHLLDPREGVLLLVWGGAAPELVRDGEVWRLLSHAFLHVNLLHLLLNMVGVVVIGPFVERALGRARMVALYLGSAVGAGALTLGFMDLGVIDTGLLVGASGAVMGLLGADAAILLTGWARERARAARTRLLVLAGIVGVQAVFDLATPQVSFTAHVCGVLVGALLALALGRPVHQSA